MNVNCSTCLELLTASDDLSSAPCGHIFHSICIIQWLETGKSNCPQCRAKCFERQLRRIFFTEGASVVLDSQCNANTLQDKIDSLTFKLRCSDTNLKTANEARDKAVAQASALREELRDVEIKLSSAKEETAATIVQNRLLRGQKPIADKAKEEAKKLRADLESYKHIDFIINSSAAEVNSRMHQLCDFSNATRESSIIIVTLKQELEKKGKEVKQIRNDSAQKSTKINELRQQVAMLTQNKRSLEEDNEKLTKDLAHNDEEVEVLRVKLKSFQDAINSPRVKSPTHADILSPLEIKPKECGILKLTRTKSMAEPQDQLDRSPCKDQTNVRLLASSQNLALISSQPNMTTSKPCLTKGIFKRSRIDDLKSPSPIAPSHMFYDGLGGHSKLDSFPVPLKKDFKIKQTSFHMSKKPKGVSRPKMSSNHDSGRPIDDFFSALKS